MTSRKKSMLWISGLLMFVGVAGYLIHGHPLTKGENMVKSASFSGEDSAFDFTFEYPIAGWSLDTSHGRTEKYDALYLRGTLDESTRFRTLIEVVVKSVPATGGPEAQLGAFLKRIESWSKFKVISQKEIKLGGEKAFSAVFEYEARLPIQQLNAKPVMIKEQTMFLARKEKLYRFSLHSLAGLWKEHAAVFEKVLDTFKFKD